MSPKVFLFLTTAAKDNQTVLLKRKERNTQLERNSYVILRQRRVDFKSGILNMLKELEETISKLLNKSMRISHQIENINKELEISFLELYGKSRFEKYNN